MAHYILLGVHILVVILEGIIVFVFFSGTIWFAAGLLGQLSFSVVTTLPFWVLRFVICYLPWVYKRFIADNSVTPWQHGVYGFLTVLDIISCIALGISLCYTICCLTDKHMYIPYHTAINQRERETADAINTHGVGADDISYHQAHNHHSDVSMINMDGTSRQVRFHDPSMMHTPSQTPLGVSYYSMIAPGGVRNDSFSFAASTPTAHGLPPLGNGRGRSRPNSEMVTPRQNGSVSARSYA